MLRTGNKDVRLLPRCPWLVSICFLVLLTSPLLAQEPTGSQVAMALERTLVDAIAAAERSVVAIARVKHGDEDDRLLFEPRQDPFGGFRLDKQPQLGDPDFIPNGFATGVVVDAHGLILTCYHVLGEQSDLYVTTADRKIYPARIIGADPRSDLAVLSIKAKEDLAPIKFGDASNLKKGQIVVALGNPYAIARDGQVSASWGIIANLQRKAPTEVDETSSSGKSQLIHQHGTLIQTDAKLNLGTSGGALVNLKGEMIGLTTSLAAISGYEQAAGYAIPIDETFRRVIDTLKQGREVEYGFLGVRPRNLEQSEILAGMQGVSIADTPDGMPARRSGLQPKDVVTHVDDIPIYDTDGLMLEIGKKPAEALVRLSVFRDNKRVPIEVTLAKYHVFGKKVVTAPAPSWRGLRVDYPDLQLQFINQRSDRFDPKGCVTISNVEEGSPAWQEGLRPEMMISHVGTTRVATPKQFYAAVADETGPVNIRLVLPANQRPMRSIPPKSTGDDSSQ